MTGVLALATLLASCSHKQIKPDELQVTQLTPSEQKATLENPDLKMVHFALNSSSLSEKARYILKRDASLLQSDRSLKFQIQGFCDERGTVKYNLALGARRAQAVRGDLEKLGVSPDRISIVSFGKADPLDPRENETAFSINRRASFFIGDSSKNASL